MTLSARDRLLVLAPHPDDATLGAGGLLQRAAAAGASCRVVFATDGDDNPWPQRVVERRLGPGFRDRTRRAARRRREAYAAFDALGIPGSCATFLGLPDQGLTALVATNPCEVVQRLVAEFRDWKPTVLVMPSLHDLHPDHNALGLLALHALTAVSASNQPVVLTYIAHPLNTPFFPGGLRLSLTLDEQARKRAAVECHATPLILHRRAYRCTASPIETFAVASAPLGNRSDSARGGRRCWSSRGNRHSSATC